MLTIRQILAEEYGYDVDPYLSPRAAHIIRTYMVLISKCRPDDSLRIRTHINRCFADLAGANGNPNCEQRTEIRL